MKFRAEHNGYYGGWCENIGRRSKSVYFPITRRYWDGV